MVEDRDVGVDGFGCGDAEGIGDLMKKINVRAGGGYPVAGAVPAGENCRIREAVVPFWIPLA